MEWLLTLALLVAFLVLSSISLNSLLSMEVGTIFTQTLLEPKHRLYGKIGVKKKSPKGAELWFVYIHTTQAAELAIWYSDYC